MQDIAKVEDSVENEEARAEYNGQRSIILNVQKQPDANTVEVIDEIRKLLPTFEQVLPPTIKHQHSVRPFRVDPRKRA